ncbi:unnamed protein product [Adineta ricciae]|uniref:Uncharacterized protein n=1 Tax=Adineta ricciae TaxID=249248 RepID=A0A815DHJ8_ADIRI|nr:unnamed protein product [Adineta ricciae]CAF1296426.1 unnamed protein product [Adineta ricciae]
MNITSASGLLAASDLVVQIIHEKKQTVDVRRLLGAVGTGAATANLDECMEEGRYGYDLCGTDIFGYLHCGQVLSTRLDLLILFRLLVLGTSFVEGRRSADELHKDIRVNFPTMYVADICTFTPVQLINFKYVPPFYRVPFLSMVIFFFNTFLSAYKHAPETSHRHE